MAALHLFGLSARSERPKERQVVDARMDISRIWVLTPETSVWAVDAAFPMALEPVRVLSHRIYQRGEI